MILVTGASGLVGYHLCRRLLLSGNRVVGLVHNRVNPFTYGLQCFLKFDNYYCDIRDEISVRGVFNKYSIQTVFHTAAQLPYTLDSDLVGVNIGGTLNLLKYCDNVKEFIFASSMGVYSDPPSYVPVDEGHPKSPSTIYGKTKLAGEKACGDYNKSMRVLILRYAGVYGVSSEKNRAVNNFIRCALSNEPLVVDGDGSQSSDFTYVDDIVEGTLLAWKKGNGVYNIGSGQDTTLMELANMIIGITNSKSGIVQNGNEIERPFRFYLDISKARRDLGYSPRLLEDGLRKYFKEWEE